MPVSPIAADDAFTATQGAQSTTVFGNLGADNGGGLDYDPDGDILGWVAGPVFNPVGDGDRYLGAFFSDGVLGFLHIVGTVSYPHPVFSTATGMQTAEGGWVTLDTSGNFTYQSALGFSGTDTFTYTLVDADYQTTTATVTFTVAGTEGANDRPVAADDAFTLNEDTPFTGNLLADNGSGADSDPDGNALTLTPQTIYTTAGGLVAIHADGSFTYTPKAGYSGADSFDYTLLDPSGAQDIGHVTLTVAAVDDAPIARDDTFEGAHDRAITGNVLTNDSDAEGDTLTVAAAVLTTAMGGIVTLNADGSFTYQPATGFTGADSFDYTVSDPNGGSDTGTVTLDVVNHAPLAVTDQFQVPFGAPKYGNLLANDSDPDGDALQATPALLTTARGSTLAIAADGKFVYTPGEVLYGIETFSYTVTDSLGATSTGTVQFIVAPPAGGYLGAPYGQNWTGTSGHNTALLAGGDDTASGLGGNDLIGGGADDDTIFGGAGIDRLYGEADKDKLNGDAGADQLFGGSGADDLSGGDGSDRLTGGTGHDELKGGAGADLFIFTTLNAADSDRIADFKAADRLVFDAHLLGLNTGYLPDASYLATKGAPDTDHGRFLYDAKARSLYWDDDGAAATANLLLTRFDTKVTLAPENILLG